MAIIKSVMTIDFTKNTNLFEITAECDCEPCQNTQRPYRRVGRSNLGYQEAEYQLITKGWYIGDTDQKGFTLAPNHNRRGTES